MAAGKATQDTHRSGRVDGKDKGFKGSGQLHVFGPGTGVNTDLVRKYSKRRLPGNGPVPKHRP